MGLTSPKCAGWASRLEARESLMLHLTFEGCLLQNSLWLGGSQPFVLFRPSVDWMRLTRIMEGNIIYSKSINLHGNLIQKPSQKNIQNSV